MPSQSPIKAHHKHLLAAAGLAGAGLPTPPLLPSAAHLLPPTSSTRLHSDKDIPNVLPNVHVSIPKYTKVSVYWWAWLQCRVSLPEALFSVSVVKKGCVHFIVTF